MNPNRRSATLGLTAAAASLAAAPSLVRAQETTLTILSHKVHENVSRGLVTGTTGGDIAGEWAERNKVKLNWVTADIDPMHDRLLRELSLRQTSIDLALIINKYATPRMSRLLEPLDGWQQKAPIEAIDGIPQALRTALSQDGKPFAIPFRHATTGLHYNETILKERGFDRPPKTFEEVLEYARKLSFTRPDGTRVSGIGVPAGAGPFAVLSIYNAFGAEMIDQNLNVKANSPEMINALKTMNALYKEGVLPSNYATLSIDEVITGMQNGAIAMSFDPFARFTTHNDAKRSKFPGAIKVMPIPAAKSTGREFVAMTEIWAFAIPKNSANKELAWSLARELSSPANTVRAALNGNGPVRPAAYQDERLKQRLPYTQEEATAIANAVTIPSSYDNAARTGSVFMEESQAATLGLKTAEQAAADLHKRVTALIK